MRAGRKRHDHNCPPCAVEGVGGDQNGRPRFLNLAALSGIQIDPPDFTPAHRCGLWDGSRHRERSRLDSDGRRQRWLPFPVRPSLLPVPRLVPLQAPPRWRGSLSLTASGGRACSNKCCTNLLRSRGATARLNRRTKSSGRRSRSCCVVMTSRTFDVLDITIGILHGKQADTAHHPTGANSASPCRPSRGVLGVGMAWQLNG